MNNLVVVSEQTMTSREIADLVESRHDKVKQSIERLVTRGVISVPQSVEYQISGSPIGGAVGREFLICKRDSYVIVAQLCPEFTARLVDRWQELEFQQAKPKELSRLEILEIAVATEKENIALKVQIEAAKPAVEFVDRYVDSTGLKGFRQVCKLLNIKEPEFRVFLQDCKIMYKLGGEWMPFADHIDAGRFVVKAGSSDQNGHAFNSAKFTPKGIKWVAGEYAKYQLENKKGK